jgi:putative sigma-54 modulation protein
MTIKILVNTMEMDLTPHLKEYVEKKLVKLNRFLDNVDEAKVDLKYNPTVRSSTDRHVAQFTIRGRNLLLRAEERSEDIYASIDAALDKLQRQIEKHKGKHSHVRTASISEINDPMTLEISDESAGASGNKIARRKKFLVEPMAEKDAIDQMQMLGHEDFFIFQNIQNGSLNVIYRRRDGTYGILEPDIR